MDFKLERIFTVIAIVAGLVGWAVIESAIWIGSKIVGLLV